MHHRKHSIPTSFMKIIAELGKAECPSLGSQPFFFKIHSCQLSHQHEEHKQGAGHPTSLGTAKGPHGHSEESFVPGVLPTTRRDRVLGRLLQSIHSRLFLGVNSKLTWILRSEPQGWGLSVVTDVSVESPCSPKREIMPTDQISCTSKGRD